MYSYTRATSAFPSIFRTLFHTCCNNNKDVRFYSCASQLLSSATRRSAVSSNSSCASQCASATVQRGLVGNFGLSTHWSATSSNVLKPKNPFWNRTSAQYLRTCCVLSKTMNLSDVLGGLEKFAPTSLAEGWDNVGLLVEPTPPHQVQTVFLTNDLTEEVLSEAIQARADFILSYHPPIFSGLKRLTMASTKERIIVKAIEKRIAIFSPHTSYDAVRGGVNDWLAEGLGPGKVDPLKHSTSSGGSTHKLEYQEKRSAPFYLPPDLIASGVKKDKIEIGTMLMFHCTVNCSEKGLASFMEAVEDYPVIKKSITITKFEKLQIPGTGSGRICKLDNPTSIVKMVELVKTHLKLQYVQLALGSNKSKESEVQSVAICAGSGASVLSGVQADVYLTGEMSHHDILAAVARGTSVIVCNHSNTERGYLPVLKSKLDVIFEGRLNIVVSQIDADPLNVV
ncbi:NIF3-like protein 1 [Asterias rubens]|uniref:NIF3-like protein 1 n=1 Tax=Asterias rubens TaxID=7604 RepID=UPI00145564AE|nr:NIF3-like protein 1 [Asterias rubens]